jgi:hypothetical protein
MALLSLSAKKAGVFLRHFTRKDKHSITRSAENSAQEGMEDTSVLLGGPRYQIHHCTHLSPPLLLLL